MIAEPLKAETKGLNFHYGPVQILKDLTLPVPENG
jgi:ABC-type arginine transport system ATPase subunit